MSAALRVPVRHHQLQALLLQQRGVLARAQHLALGGHPRSWDDLCRSPGAQLLLPGVLLLGVAPPDEDQKTWAAVLYAGPDAALSGPAALRAEGVRVQVPVLDVVVPAGRRVVAQPSPATLRSRDLARVRERRRAGAAAPHDRPQDRRVFEHELVVRGHSVTALSDKLQPGRALPRVRVTTAVLHAAAWAPSDAAAEVLLAVVVQQRRASPAAVRAALELQPALKRRALVRDVLDDLELGVQARGELQFLRLLRGAGLPEPDRLQRPLRTGTGRRYLDAWFARRRVVVELDGGHHRDVATWEADVLRADDVALAHQDARVVLLRFTTGQLRHQRPLVVAQLRRALLG